MARTGQPDWVRLILSGGFAAAGVDAEDPDDHRAAMERRPHENAATVLVDPCVLRDLEVHLMSQDLRLWPVATAPVCEDGPRTAFQVRRRLLMSRRGEWDDAAEWVPVWISFGESWYDGAEPLPWTAHQTLWRTLDEYAGHVHYRLGLGGIPRLDVPHERVG